MDACSIVPADGEPAVLCAPMRRDWQRRIVWFGKVSSGDLRRVLRASAEQGAITIRDIDNDVLVDKDYAWASRKPSKRALRWLSTEAW